MFEKLARLLPRWDATLKYWHVVWYVGTFIGTLARKNDKLALFWHFGMLARKPRWHARALARMAHNLANSFTLTKLIRTMYNLNWEETKIKRQIKFYNIISSES